MGLILRGVAPGPPISQGLILGRTRPAKADLEADGAS